MKFKLPCKALCSALGLTTLLVCAPVRGQSTPIKSPTVESLETPAHPWVALPPAHEPASYFTNLKDGDVRETPFVARFGLSMRGIVPAGNTAGRAGHHHLLINQDLPLDFKKPLPFTDHYIHFGKGQMETVINLPPGSYNLRLLLADKGHVPYFVFSKPLKLTVSKQNKDVKAASLLGTPHIELLGVSDKQSVLPPFRLQFHASGFNISDVAPKIAETGHFRLVMEWPSHKPETIEFDGGQTESWFNPPPGSYTVRLALINNVSGATMAALDKPLALTVEAPY